MRLPGRQIQKQGEELCCDALSTRFVQELTEPEVVRQAEELEAALVGQNQGALQQLCQERADKAAKPEDKETWEFIRVLFAEDARR